MKLFLLILHTVLLNLSLGADDILVTLPNGVIQGRTDVSPNGKQFYSFLSVPFGAPPVGKLRFMPPVPPDNWEGVLDATNYKAICYQMNWSTDAESEDCLQLNVFTPKLPDGGDVSLLPVMFYIYGGGFVAGSAPTGPHYLIEHDVVVVTINYRVGPFGFLSTQDEIIPGNNGLKDQLLALKWTRDNIKLFGGDPDKVTIFGQSAGSASVTYQLLHTESEGLFRGAIGESGSFLSPWAFQRRAREYAFTLAGYIDESFKDSNDSKALLEFLQGATAQQIDDASGQLAGTERLQNRQLSQGFFFAPVIEPEHDGAFITEKMYVSLKAGNNIKVPLLIGVNSEECITDAGNIDGHINNMKTYDQNLDWLVPDDMRIEDIDRRKDVGAQIRRVYVGDSTFEENLGAGIRYLSDTSFTRSVIMHAELQSQSSDVYFYQFSYDGRLGNVDATIEGAEKVAHSEENNYIWYSDWNADLSQFPEGDQITQNRIQKIFTDFAKTLNPTPEASDLLQNIIWPKVTDGGRGSFLYVDIDTELAIKDHPKGDAYKGWNEIYANLGYDDFDTY